MSGQTIKNQMENQVEMKWKRPYGDYVGILQFSVGRFGVLEGFRRVGLESLGFRGFELKTAGRPKLLNSSYCNLPELTTYHFTLKLTLLLYDRLSSLYKPNAYEKHESRHFNLSWKPYHLCLIPIDMHVKACQNWNKDIQPSICGFLRGCYAILDREPTVFHCSPHILGGSFDAVRLDYLLSPITAIPPATKQI